MFITFKTLIGKTSCLQCKKVSQEYKYLSFTHNGSKFNLPIEDLISIQEIPDIPRIAFIHEFTWKIIESLLTDKNVIWHKDYLYCHSSDCREISKILTEIGDEEIIISELPIEEYEYRNR
jgi:hypothetical protein